MKLFQEKKICSEFLCFLLSRARDNKLNITKIRVEFKQVSTIQNCFKHFFCFLGLIYINIIGDFFKLFFTREIIKKYFRTKTRHSFLTLSYARQIKNIP